MTIGEALYQMLLSLSLVAELAQDRVSAITFREGTPLPALNYNTKDIKPLPCRDSGGVRMGTLEIGIMAADDVTLEELSDYLAQTLNPYENTHAGYHLRVYLSPDDTDDFDEKVENAGAFFKALQFKFFATKLV